MDYVVVIHPAEEGGFWAEVPLLDGCFAQGETIDEVTEDVRGAIRSHIDALREAGEPVPEPSDILVTTVNVSAA